MKIKDYVNKKNINIQKQNAVENNNNNFDPISTYNTYSKLNDEQRMQEMFRVAETMRANGSLDNNALDEFLNNSASFLSLEQQERMRELIIMLKRT